MVLVGFHGSASTDPCLTEKPEVPSHWSSKSDTVKNFFLVSVENKAIFFKLDNANLCIFRNTEASSSEKQKLPGLWEDLWHHLCFSSLSTLAAWKAKVKPLWEGNTWSRVKNAVVFPSDFLYISWYHYTTDTRYHFLHISWYHYVWFFKMLWLVILGIFFFFFAMLILDLISVIR